MSARALRRTKPSIVARVRAFWVLGALALAALAIAFAAFANAPQLRIRTVEVVLPPAAPVAKDAVLSAAAIAPDANVVLLHAGAIRQRIEALPYVDTVAVHRSFLPAPGVSLAVTVRRPAACLDAGGRQFTLDATSRVLATGCADPALPLLRFALPAAPAPGARLDDPAFVKLAADAATVEKVVPLRSAGLDRFGGLEAIDRSGVMLRLGDGPGLEAKIALVEPIRRALGRGRRLRAIDLRAPTTPTVEFP